eukprot:1621319-Rhodomonas_salina.1
MHGQDPTQSRLSAPDTDPTCTFRNSNDTLSAQGLWSSVEVAFAGGFRRKAFGFRPGCAVRVSALVGSPLSIGLRSRDP